jgi:hypothetical protein
MRIHLVLLALALVTRSLTAEARPVSYAVVIGNNAPPADAPGERLETLRYADDDAVRFYKLLSQFSRTTLMSTLDDQTQKRHPKIAALARVPSLDELRQVFATLGNDMRLDREAGNEPVLYFVFSGHGAIAEGGDAFLALTDGRLTQRVLFEELIGSLPTPRTHVIIDACHAAGIVGARGGTFFGAEKTGETAPVTEAETIAIAKGTILQRYPNVGVIVATTLGNETHEWSAIEAGVFSYEVLSGLAGPADVNGDRIVEYSELHAFVANANRSINNPRAVPLVVSEAPRADRRSPIVKLQELRTSYLLEGKVGGWGRFRIETEDGQRLLDANMTNERKVTVALPIGVAAYVRTATGEAKISSGGKAIAVNDVQMTAPTVASRGGVDADYRQNLFATPYGPTYYTGFVDSQTGAVAVDFDINLHVQGELVDEAPRRPTIDRDPGRWSRRGGYALAGVTVVTGGLAILFGALALEERSDFNASATQEEASWHAHDYKDITATFWVTTAVTGLAAYGSYRLFKRGRRLNVGVTPSVSAGGPPGLSVGGSF